VLTATMVLPNNFTMRAVDSPCFHKSRSCRSCSSVHRSPRPRIMGSDQPRLSARSDDGLESPFRGVETVYNMRRIQGTYVEWYQIVS
jgi:hypothetical protein